MKPLLDILPPHQRRLWSELSHMPGHFVLYGGTAIALRLASRQSVDFDFFTEKPLSADDLARELPFLHGARMLQAQPNTVTFSVERDGAIKVSFFGSLSFGRVGAPERCEDNGLWIASLLDLAAQKMKVILTRADPKDYLDIHALIEAGISLPMALAAASGLYPEFNPLISLKALAYYEEPTLASLPASIRDSLIRASTSVDFLAPLKKSASTISAGS